MREKREAYVMRQLAGGSLIWASKVSVKIKRKRY
jgi:hypothetical protein